MFEQGKQRQESTVEITPENGLIPEEKFEVTPEVIQERVGQERSLLQRAWGKIGGSSKEQEEGKEEIGEKQNEKNGDLKKKLMLYGIAAFIGANAVLGAMSSKGEARGRHHRDRDYGYTVVIDPVGIVLGGIGEYRRRQAEEEARQRAEMARQQRIYEEELRRQQRTQDAERIHQQRMEEAKARQGPKQEQQEQRISPDLRKALEGLGEAKARKDHQLGKDMDVASIEGYIAETLGDKTAANEQARVIAVGKYVKTWIELDQQAKVKHR